MKKLFLIYLLILTGLAASGQKKDHARCRPVTFNPGTGYMNINEVHYGYSIRSAYDIPGKYYYGFTPTHGYQLNIRNMSIDNSLLCR